MIMKKFKKVLNFTVIIFYISVSFNMGYALSGEPETEFFLRVPMDGKYGRVAGYLSAGSEDRNDRLRRMLLSPVFLGMSLPEDTRVRSAFLNEEQVFYEIIISGALEPKKAGRIKATVENTGGIAESFVYTQSDIDEFEKLLEMEATFFGKKNPFSELKNELTVEEYMDFYAELYLKMSGAAERSVASLLAISASPETDREKRRALEDIKNAHSAFNEYLRKGFIEDIESFLRARMPDRFYSLTKSGSYLGILKAIANSVGNSVFSESYAISTSGYESLAVLREDSDNYKVFEKDINKLQKVLENFSRKAFDLPTENPYTHIMIIMPVTGYPKTDSIMDVIKSSKKNGTRL